MTALRWFWLALAVLGALAALWQAVTSGWPLRVPGAAVCAVALIAWICSEVWVRRNLEALAAIPATLLAGPGFGLPLYLFLRTRPM